MRTKALWIPAAALVAVLIALPAASARAGTIDPELETALAARAPHEEIAVIVRLAERVDPRQHEVTDRRRRDGRLVKALRSHAQRTQSTHKSFLQDRGGHRLRELWAINAMAVTVRADAVRELAARPGVERVSLDGLMQAPVPQANGAAPPEWNLNAVRAPDLWSLGFSGAGVVVANMDTGVDGAHPDLATRWRGGANSWYDPHGEHTTPYDANGHGTMTMGVLVGGAAGGTAIGVAPDARWIAAKMFNDAGVASVSDVHLAFQWLLDPDGDPNTADSPDVVNGSWGAEGGAGLCLTEFSADIDALKAAGIAIVFAAGNDGPGPNTSLSPANYPYGFSAGAVDATLTVADFSSRGPSACDGTIYPWVVAPGVSIRTSDLSFGGLPLYATVSGTSFSAPHAAGVMALLAGAFPNAIVRDLELAIRYTAQDRGVPGADYAYGYGLLNGLGAYQYLAARGGTILNGPPTANPDSYTILANGRLNLAAPGLLANDTDPEGDPLVAGNFGALNPPGAIALRRYADGSVWFRPPTEFVGTKTFTYRARDLAAANSSPTTVTINVIANRAPVALDDAASAPVRTQPSYAPATITALANDSDPDAGIDPNNTIQRTSLTVVAAPDAGGTVTKNANNTFAYTPAIGFSGTESFTYRVSDRLGAWSNVATVRVAVQ